MNDKKIESTVENWENGKLGCDEAFVQVHEITEEETSLIHKSLDLEKVDIVLEKEILDECKRQAYLKGIGYKTFLRLAVKEYIK